LRGTQSAIRRRALGDNRRAAEIAL